MKAVIAWFAENHVASNLLMLFLMAAGFATAMTTKIEIFPEIAMDKIAITTEYQGASPAEIEEAVLKKIEEKIAGIAGIKRIDSSAREGFGTITIEVMSGWDIKKLLDEVKSEVDRITTLPDEAEKPSVSEITRRTQVIDIAVYGDAPETTLKHIAERIKDDVTNLPGITLAETYGVREGEIHIEISEMTLKKYNLTLEKVANMVRQASLDLPAGNIKTSSGEILIRSKGKRYYAADYRDIAVITSENNGKVTLGQIADLKDGFEDVDLSARFQGKPAATIKVYRVADQNALKVVASVKKYIENMRESLPEGVNIDVYDDNSVILKSRINLLVKNMCMGLVLVSVLLGLFLNIKLAFWITMGIPLSFLAGLWVLPYFDVSINMVSLFGFIMVLGMVVDDAIVIGENIYSKQNKGLTPLHAAIEGAYEVGKPVIFAVLTTMAAFYPLLLGGGALGKVIRNIPLVVIMVLFASLVESLVILPSHLAGSIKKRNTIRPPASERFMAKWLEKTVNGPYARFARFCVKWRYVTVATAIAILLGTVGSWKGGWIKFTLMPKVESDVLTCTLTMPVGVPVKQTEDIITYLEKTAKETLDEMDKKRDKNAPSLFKYSFSLIGMHAGGHGPAGGEGQQGGHLGQVFIQLLNGEERDVSSMKLANLWRGKAGIIPGVESITFQSDLFTIGNPIEIHLSLDDNDRLVEAADELKAELKKYPGVFNIDDSFLPGKKEIQLNLKEHARSLGLTLQDLARQTRNAFYGAEALRLQKDKDEVKVLVRYPESDRKKLDSIEKMRIRTSDGAEIPFSQVAQVKMESGYATIQRAQRRRVIKIFADVDEKVANANEVRGELEKRYIPDLVNRYPGLRYKMEGEGREQKEAMDASFLGFQIALFAIYVLLAIPFRSFVQPMIVMTAIPFGITGAVMGHLIMGFNLSMLSVFGMVGLAGVVVNDSLVLVDAINRIRQDTGAPIDSVVVEAGILRFRAILLTSLTTFAGLIPIITEKSTQAQFLIPMALSLGFGVLFSTGVTLLLVPCGIVILDDIQTIFTKTSDMIFRRSGK